MATALEKALDWNTKLPAPGGMVNYYFYDENEPTPLGASAGWVQYEKDQFRKAFDIYESFLNLHFHEVDQDGQAHLLLVSYGEQSSTLGFMFPPGEPNAGYGYFNYLGLGWDYTQPGTGALEQGGFGFVTIIHELGHGLGLAHPHDTGGKKGNPSIKFPGVSNPNELGTYFLNQGVYTTMSYNDGWLKNPSGASPSFLYGYQGTPMAIDIAVLQAKYGANMAHNVGNNTYVLPKANGTGTFYSCIWDAGGEDTIAHSGSRPALIDLRAATLKVEPGGGGFVSYADGVHGGFTIANGVVIENAIGGDNDDWLMGNDAANVLSGKSGADGLNGGRGADTLNGGSGRDTLTGRNGADDLRGGSGRDTLKGNSGADILFGGGGRDLVKGGNGNDAFAFAEKVKQGKADTLPDFSPGDDVIWLDQSFFKGLGSPGTLKASKFHTGDAAHDKSDRVIYDDDSGALIYDKNGSKSGGAKTFAKLDDGLDLGHKDFIVIA